ncbi:MAG: hypothetical protein ACRDV3_07370 [Acidothermaceae bacterium]
MKHVKRNRGWIAGWAAAGFAVTGIAAAGVANAATSNGAPTATSSATGADATTPANLTSSNAVRGKALAKIERKVAGKATHGEIVLDTKKGLQTVDFQRGTISAASTSGFAVTDKGGTTETWASTATTRVRERSGKGSKASSGQIVNGETAVVIGTKDGDTMTARLVVVLPATSQPSAQPTG